MTILFGIPLRQFYYLDTMANPQSYPSMRSLLWIHEAYYHKKDISGQSATFSIITIEE